MVVRQTTINSVEKVIPTLEKKEVINTVSFIMTVYTCHESKRDVIQHNLFDML